MIDSRRLLADLTKLLATLEADLRRQVQERDDVRAPLQTDYDAARRVGRTQDTFETWCEEPITQAAVAWLLGTVYVRFLEDNALVDPMLSGTGARYTRAQHEHQHYFQQHPTHSERQYLEYLFARLEQSPATKALFDRRHNPLWRLPLSADAARAVVEFWQRIDPDTGQVAHDFADPALDTRFLGDLYQDLSEPVRKRYALLQTPRFVEAFILDRTLTPAIETFGYREVRLIDPTCGSGHFLLGAFDRLLALAQEHEPGKDVRVLVQDVLSRVVGVDINPYAVAIAHFRLMVGALRACGITRLVNAPGFDVSVVAADSLLHGPRFADREMGAVQASMLEGHEVQQYYFAEDETRVRALLGQQYHAVVGNPPYITVKDAALREMYRQRYRSCSGKYALVVPFMERFFELALQPDMEAASRAGYVGLIVANSFMKREFGKKLIEEFIPRWDLTHVVDASGADIPGHGTPTAILFGRHRRPQLSTVRAVRGVRGEPNTPDDPAKGLVWMAILEQIDRPASESTYVSVADADRATFHRHPWSIGGGGAAELKTILEEAAVSSLSALCADIGPVSFPGIDDVFVMPLHAQVRLGVPVPFRKPFCAGDSLRDWVYHPGEWAIAPYDASFVPVDEPALGSAAKHFWRFRTTVSSIVGFGGRTRGEEGEPHWTWYRWISGRFRSRLSISFAFIATHNHFVLDRGGKVFNRSAPVIKLKEGATEGDHLALLGLLNSSTACFWMKQVFYPKASSSGDISLEKGKPEANRFEFTATGLLECPVPFEPSAEDTTTLRTLARELVETGELASALDRAWVQSIGEGGDAIKARIRSDEGRHEALRGRMVTLQEELDWEVYRLFGLSELGADMKHMPRQGSPIDASCRPFALDAAAPPDPSLPDRYRERFEAIRSDRSLATIESPVYKRLWLGRQGVYGHASLTFLERCRERLAEWLADRFETANLWSAGKVLTSAKLADALATDRDFMSVAEAYTEDPSFDVAGLIDAIVRDQSVPSIPALRYTESGLRKRAQWERTWDLQRRQDAGEKVRDIPVPPKYTSADFRSGTYWRLRGKLDVPKERFVSYPGCERAADGSLPIAWAGWDHAQQARALGAYYMQLKTEEGTVPDKLVPLLAGLLELIPWIRQWHAGPDPEFGLELGPYYADFVENEARALGLTVEQVRAWRPIAAPKRGRKAR